MSFAINVMAGLALGSWFHSFALAFLCRVPPTSNPLLRVYAWLGEKQERLIRDRAVRAISSCPECGHRVDKLSPGLRVSCPQLICRCTSHGPRAFAGARS